MMGVPRDKEEAVAASLALSLKANLPNSFLKWWVFYFQLPYNRSPSVLELQLKEQGELGVDGLRKEGKVLRYIS